MDQLWLLDYLHSRQQNLKGGSDLLQGRSLTDLSLLGAALSGDMGGALTSWAARQTAPALQAFLTQQLGRAGLGAGAAGFLGTVGAPLLIMGLINSLKRSTAKPSDTGYMLGQQRQAVLQSEANRVLNEAVGSAQRSAQGILGTAQSMAGSNQFLGSVLSQAVAPSVAQMMGQIVQQGLQAKAELVQSALEHQRRRQLEAENFGRQLYMDQLQADRQRRNMMLQMMMAMLMPTREES